MTACICLRGNKQTKKTKQGKPAIFTNTHQVDISFQDRSWFSMEMSAPTVCCKWCCDDIEVPSTVAKHHNHPRPLVATASPSRVVSKQQQGFWLCLLFPCVCFSNCTPTATNSQPFNQIYHCSQNRLPAPLKKKLNICSSLNLKFTSKSVFNL